MSDRSRAFAYTAQLDQSGRPASQEPPIATPAPRPVKPDARAFIRAQFPLRPVPDAPQIRLHLAGPSSGLHRLADLVGDGFRTPYWAYPWAGGVALARHILDHPEIVRGRRVLDLGTGSGLVAVAAALAGARSVEAVDVDPLALVAVDLNAEANGAAVSPRFGDPAESAAPDVDLVCAGDVFYAPTVAKASFAFLERCRDAGRAVLIGDPWRADLPSGRLRVIERYAVRDFGDGASPTEAAVFTLAERRWQPSYLNSKHTKDAKNAKEKVGSAENTTCFFLRRSAPRY